MNTKELLEKAAKAAGIKGNYFESEYPTESGILDDDSFDEDTCALFWQPHLDDGDSARLADALEINIRYLEYGLRVYVDTGRHHAEYYKDHNNSRSAARRMAVLRLAAQMGDGL